MTKRTEGWAMLDQLIATMGEEGVLAMVCTRIAIGENPQDIALGMGMPWLVLRRWMEDKPERMKDWELAKRCFADGLMWSGLAAARDADIESVQLARLQADVFHKTAAKMSRDEWGEKQQVEVKVDGMVSLKELIRLRDERVQALGEMRVIDIPVVVEESQVEEI